jgi:AraC-like DNA-binding protein
VDKKDRSAEDIPAFLAGKNSLLDQITDYVKANLAEKLTLKMVAGQFGVSVSTVTQLFQKKAQTTFHEFVTQCRMEKARKLVLKGKPLEAVGRAVGYRDHSTFYRAFRQTFGVSPREYRKNRISDI